ncbi:MAG: hypothetical protein ACREIC_21670 [Limisphaerales bacterium]
MSKPQRILLLCGLVILALAGTALLGHHSGSARLLRAYKANLLSKGENLTYAALTGSRSTNWNSSNSVLTNAYPRLLVAKLNVNWLNLRQYTGPGQARALCLDRPERTNSAGSVASTWVEMGAELSRIEAPLEEIREAMKNPQAQGNSSPFTGLPNFIAIRSAVQWLSVHAVYEFHEGRIEAGLGDIEALVGLAQVNRDEYTLVAQMIRIAVAGLGLATTWEGLQAPGWTEAQLQRLQSAWQQVDLADALEKGLSGERAMGEDLWSTLRQTNGLRSTSAVFARPLLGSANTTNSLASFFSENIYFPVYRMTSIDDDELLYLKTMQGSLDALRSLRTGSSWPMADRAWDRTFGPLLEVTRSLERFRFPFSTIGVPNFLKAMSIGAHAETERQVTVTAIALKRFQLAHAEAPRTLDALTPDYLASAPRDLMSGRTLRYALRPGTSPLLYSVGTDGVDNGGDPSSAQQGKLGLWDGRDAVWPEAAEP